MDESGKSEVSIASVFIVTAAILFGWQYAVLLAAVSIGVTYVATRRTVAHTVFNSSMYAISAFGAALPVMLLGPVHGQHPARLTAYILFGGAIHLAANVALVAGAISASQAVPYREVLLPGLRRGGAAFGVMVLLAALAANLWVMQSWLLVLLAGPLFTLTLYQRSALHSHIASRAALTDNLTGLGNHRAYQAALREGIAECERDGRPFSLCLVDVDNFKQVNDRYGHPVGDDLLVLIGGLLSGPERAQAFRFGGDEFAVIFSLDEMSAYREFEQIQQQLALMDASPGDPVTISIGIASYPAHADSPDELQRRADGALYWSKQHGKNRSCLYSPSVVRIYTRGGAGPRDRAERAAARGKNLVRLRCARDPSTANHSQMVSALAEAIDLQLQLDAETVNQLQLAGLHPRHREDRPRRDPERAAAAHGGRVRDRQAAPRVWPFAPRRPRHRAGRGLGLHHHEHWDGSGYPHGLAGEQIPLGARILLADAFEAITADRPYRRRRASRQRSPSCATRRAQFDPTSVRHSSGIWRPPDTARRGDRLMALALPLLAALALAPLLGGRWSRLPRFACAGFRSSMPRSLSS
jgi:diguanylate cyclase (GGDEF)-like protein